MRVVYDREWLDDPKCELEYVPLNDNECCVFVLSYDGVPVTSITDRITAQVGNLRKRYKKLMKKAVGFRRKCLNATQLSCKVVANSLYGFLGSDTSGMSCTALAAAVCAIGQWQNKVARHAAMVAGCICVYGDTDSIMIIIPIDLSKYTTRNEIFAAVWSAAVKLAAETTKLYPHPNELEAESIKFPFLLTKKKKTYAALEYDDSEQSWLRDPKVLIKGMTVKKRDRCPWVREIGKAAIHKDLLLKAPIQAWEARLRAHVAKFDDQPTTSDLLAPYIITCRLADTYADPTVVVGAVLAQMIERKTGIKPKPGRRLAYVVVYKRPSYGQVLKLVDRTLPVAQFLGSGHRLDASYYLETQLLLALKQCFDISPEHYQVACDVINEASTRWRQGVVGQRRVDQLLH